jgi:hypothetical protein
MAVIPYHQPQTKRGSLTETNLGEETTDQALAAPRGELV